MPAFKDKLVVHEYGDSELITEDDKYIFKETTYHEPLLAHVKELQEQNHQVGARIGSQNHMRHVAEVPMSVYNQAHREQWGQKEWRRWLNDPDNAPLRVTKGRV